MGQNRILISVAHTGSAFIMMIKQACTSVIHLLAIQMRT